MRALVVALVVALVLALVVVGVFFRSSSGRRGAGVETGARASTDGATADPAALARAPRVDVAENSVRERIASETVGEASPPVEATSPATTARLVVRGTVLFARDRVPAAHARFLLHHPGGHVLVDADEHGRFTASGVVPGVLRPWHLATPGDERLGVRLRFAEETLALESGARDELELVLVEPAAHLRVEVVTVDGLPAEDARVQLAEAAGEDDAPGFPRLTTVKTDAEGRGAFPLYDLERLARADVFALDAEREAASERVVLALPPRDAPVRLVLAPAGRIRVRVLDGAGGPVPGQRVASTPGEPASAWPGGTLESDSSGEARFGPLPPGTYALGLVGAPEARATVEVLRGVEQEVELRLPAPLVALAAAGIVLDEDGDPLADVDIGAVLDGGVEWSTTDLSGRFEVRASECPTVRLVSDRDPYGDVYEPAEQEVLFGTHDVVFRRVRGLPRLALSLEILDASTGARVPRVLLLGYRLPHLGNYSFHRAPDGLVEVPLTLHEGSRLAIEAPGYRRRVVDPGPLLAASPEGGVHRVTLEPGLHRTVRVLDAETEQPLADVRVLAHDVLVALTDAAGTVELDLHRAVDALVFEAEGREPETVDPAGWMSDLELPAVFLRRP